MRLRVALFAIVLLAACSGISFENQSAVEGTYTLSSVRGLSLPVELDDRPVPFTVTSGVLTLGSNGDWSEVLTGTALENGQSVSRQLTESGRWTLRNPNVEIVRADGAIAYSGSFSVIICAEARSHAPCLFDELDTTSTRGRARVSASTRRRGARTREAPALARARRPSTDRAAPRPCRRA